MVEDKEKSNDQENTEQEYTNNDLPHEDEASKDEVQTAAADTDGDTEEEVEEKEDEESEPEIPSDEENDEVTIETTESEETVESDGDTPIEDISNLPETETLGGEESRDSVYRPTEETSAGRDINLGASYLMSFGCGVLALILALVIGLGVLAGLNGGSLIFASPAQVSELTIENERTAKEMKDINQDLDSLKVRMDKMEGLSGRLDAVEEDSYELVQQMESINSQIVIVEKKIEDFSQAVQEVKEENSRFQRFFSGLQNLINQVLPTEEGSDER